MLLLLMSLSLVAFAQQGNVNDILFTKSGEIIQGKVVKVTNSTISFSYPGESLVNEISSDQLQKIVFSSGRTQNFASSNSGSSVGSAPTTSAPEESIATTTIPKEEIYLGPDESSTPSSIGNNRLSVTPMTFLINGKYSKEISGQATKFATDYLARQNQSLPIEIQDMGVTIKKLVGAGIGFQQLSQTSVDQLQNVLGSEYLVLIEVNQNHQKEQAKKDSGFFDVQKEQAQEDSSIRYEIEVILFGTGGAETYSAKFSSEQSFKSALGTNASQNDWKTAMQYVLDQILTSGSL